MALTFPGVLHGLLTEPGEYREGEWSAFLALRNEET
jgi:hypothetical protein